MVSPGSVYPSAGETAAVWRRAALKLGAHPRAVEQARKPWALHTWGSHTLLGHFYDRRNKFPSGPGHCSLGLCYSQNTFWLIYLVLRSLREVF